MYCRGLLTRILFPEFLLLRFEMSKNPSLDLRLDAKFLALFFRSSSLLIYLRALAQFYKCSSPIEKYNLLSVLRYTNETLFYYLLINNMVEMIPIVYTPTVCSLQAENQFGSGHEHYLTFVRLVRRAESLDNTTNGLKVLFPPLPNLLALIS